MSIQDELKSVLGTATQGGGASGIGGALQGAMNGAAYGNPLGGALSGLLGNSNPLVSMIAPMLLGGGLTKLLSGFGHGSAASKAASWVGTGANEPVSADEVRSALGSNMIADLAAKTGMTADDVATQLAATLPSLVDKVTPNGSLPTEDELLAILQHPSSS